MVTLTRRQKMLYSLSAIFSLFLLFLGRERITDIVGGSDKNKFQVSVLLAELQKLPVPNSDAWLDRPQTFDKGVITGATAHFRGASPPKDVLLYYSRALSLMGWTFANRERGVNGEKIKFCKSGMSLTIDASPEGVATKYYIGIVWTKFRGSPAYCASSDPSSS